MVKTLKINGMGCGGCVSRVKKALEEVPGVASADVSLGKKEAVVTSAADAVLTDQALKAAVEAGGKYTVTEIA